MALLDRLLGRQQPQPIRTVELPTAGPRALTAAAARVDLTERSEGTRLHTAQPWQADAWVYRRAIGEVRYGIDWLGNVMSRLRLQIAVVVDPTVDPVPIDEARELPVDEDGQPTGEPALAPDIDQQLADDAESALARLAGGGGLGHAAILKPFTVNFEVPGECYLIGRVDPDDPEQQTWEIRSTDELTRDRNGNWMLRDAPASGAASVSAQGATAPGVILLGPDDYVARLWNPDPRWRSLPDSPMAGVLDPCEALLLKTRKGRVRDRARLSRGVLLVAQELDFVGPDGRPTDFQSTLTASMVAAVSDEGAASSLSPIVLRAPAERIKDGTALAHVDVIDKADETRDADEVDKLLARIVRGLDFPPEVVEGLGDVKYSNAVAIDSTSFRYHIEPKAQTIVDALTVGFLWPWLEALGWPAERARQLVVWYDPSAVVSNPNRLPDAKMLHDANALSDEALREAAGFGDADKPDEAEQLRRLVFHQRTLPPGLSWAIIAEMAERAGLDVPMPPTDPAAADVAPGVDQPGGVVPPGEPPAALPSGEGQQPPAIAAAATPAPVLSPYGDRTLALDLDLRGRVEAAADAAVRRALERAGARVVSKAGRDSALRQRTAGLPTSRVCAALGPEAVGHLGLDDTALLAGAFDELAGQFRTWCTATFEQGLQETCALLGQAYVPPDEQQPLVADGAGSVLPVFSDLGGLDLVALRARFAADVAAAADGLVADLIDTARGRLYEPPTIPGQGEYDPNLTVAPADIRRALAGAGGADTSLTFSGLDSGGQPAAPADPDPGLVATGLTLRDSLRLAGVAQYAYRWTWGGSPRPFLPHKDLDGLVFEDQTDPALAVSHADRSWLSSTSYRPSDHPGCRCTTAFLFEDPFAGLSATDAARVRAAQKARDVRGRFVGSAPQ